MPVSPREAQIEQVIATTAREFGSSDIYVNEGFFSTVILAPDATEPHVIKIPKPDHLTTSSPDTLAINNVVSEEMILRRLESVAESSPISIQRVLAGHRTDPLPHLVLSYLPGNVPPNISGELPWAPESVDVQLATGRKIAAFALWFSGSIDLDFFTAKLESLQNPHSTGDRDTLMTPLADFPDSPHAKDYPILASFARRLNIVKAHAYPYGIAHAADRIVHGDLRPANIVFSGLYQHPGDLSGPAIGVIDFGAVRRGEPQEEMRGLYHLGSHAIKGANDFFAENGMQTIDPKVIEFWQTGRVVNGLARVILADKLESELANFASNIRFLRTNYPNDDWSELPSVD